jgi:hypothetical protein
LAYFVDCILTDQTPFNDGHAGLRVVKMLEAANRSMQKRGELVYVSDPQVPITRASASEAVIGA